jgi:hypothetical protein
VEGLLAIAMPAILKAHLVDQVGAVVPEAMLGSHLAAAQEGQGHLGKEMLVAAEAQTMRYIVLEAGAAGQVGLAQTSPLEQVVAAAQALRRLLLDRLSLGLGVVREQGIAQTDRLDRVVEERLLQQGRSTRGAEEEAHLAQEVVVQEVQA